MGFQTFMQALFRIDYLPSMPAHQHTCFSSADLGNGGEGGDTTGMPWTEDQNALRRRAAGEKGVDGVAQERERMMRRIFRAAQVSVRSPAGQMCEDTVLNC